MMPQFIISFDLESSDILRDFTSLDTLPTVVQLGYCITSMSGDLLHSQCDYVQPRCVMSEGAIERHGISQFEAERLGKSPEDTLLPFFNLLENWADRALVIGWNATKFDFPLLEVEALRLGRDFQWVNGIYRIYDVMHAMARGGGRWQKLEDTYEKFFQSGMNAHNAEADALATARIYHHLRVQNKLPIASYE